MSTQAKVILSAEDRTAAAFASASRGLEKFGLSAAAAQSGLSAIAAGASVGALIGAMKSAVNYADEMGKFAQKAGTTSQAFSGLAYAANMAEVSNEQLAKGLRALGKDAGDGGKKLSEIGVSLTDASGRAKSADILFSEVAARFAAMPDGIDKTNLAITIFGEKIGPELIPLLNGGAAGMKAMTEEAERLGKVVGDDAAAQADKFNDALDRLAARAQGMAITVAAPIVKALNHVIDQFELTRKHSDSFFSSLFLPGTANAAEKIGDLRKELAGLEGDRARYVRAGSETSGIDQAIANTKRSIGYLQDFQNQQKAASVRYGADDQSGAEARRLGIAPPTRIPNASNPPRISARRITAPDQAQRPDLELDAISAQFDAMDKQREARARRAAQITEKTLTPLEKLAATEAELDRLRRDGLLGEEALARARFDAAEAYESTQAKAVDAVRAVNAGAEEATEQARLMGAAFSSTFDRVFTEGMSVGDLLKKLAFDAINIKFITPGFQKASSSIGTAVSSLFSFDGGGYTGSGSRSGGLDGKGGFMAMLHPNETVLDHTRGQGGGTVINQYTTIDARGADAGVEQRIRAAMAQTKAETLAAVQSKANRGGSFSAALGRA